MYDLSHSVRAEDLRGSKNRKALGDLFPISARQMERKGAQTKPNYLMWYQSQNAEKAKNKIKTG